jgi:TPR repeat protein
MRAFVMLPLVLLVLSGAGNLAAQTATHSPVRSVALIVGIADYEKGRKLDNPVNDATAVDTALKELGFDTVLVINSSRAALREALDQFYAKIASADVIMFYFAGHGAQINDQNFIVPADANPESAGSLIAQLQPLDEILNAIEMNSKPRASKIIVLDACRNDPLKGFPEKPGERIGQGLARIKAAAPDSEGGAGSGYFRIIAFSTAADTAASDGTAGNSPYTASLIKHIRQPGIEIVDMFRNVANDVVGETGKQKPELLLQTYRELYLRVPHITDCDRVAIEEQNFLGLPGIPFDDVNPAKAIPACKTALKEQPDSARLHNNIARAYEKVGRLDEAFRHYKASADAGYPPAINALGIMYLSGCGLAAPNVKTGIRNIARASDLGNLSARATLTSHDLLPYVDEGGVLALQLSLAQAAAYRGATDGKAGPKLRAALAGYQRTHQLQEKGLTLETINALQLYDIVPEGFRCH